MARYWHRREGSLDEVYLNGQLVLYPFAASEDRGLVYHAQTTVGGEVLLTNDGDPVMAVSTGRVEVVRVLTDDTLWETEDE